MLCALIARCCYNQKVLTEEREIPDIERDKSNEW